MNYAKKLSLGFFSLLVLSLFSVTALLPSAVFAGLASEFGVTDIDNIRPSIRTAEWLDAAHIRITFNNNKTLVFTPGGVSDNGGTNLQDERLSDETGYGINYSRVEGDGFNCYNSASVKFDIDESRDVFDKQQLQLNEGHIDIDFRPNPDSDCEDGNEFDMPLANPQLSIAYFKWVSPTQIGMVDGDNPGNFTKGTTTAVVDGVTYEVFLSDDEASASSCRDKLLYNPAANVTRWYDLSESADGNPPDSVSTNCSYNDENDSESWPRNNYDWPVANRAADVAGVPVVAPGSSGPGSSLGDDSCESRGGAMGWLLCPTINIIDSALSWVDEQVQSLLAIDEDKYTNKDLKSAWTSIRNIAYVILIPIMLVMVIGTALGFDVFSAYTVKKALPRMVVAIIFITFSWYICTFLIGFFNVVGSGILGLFTSPFREQIPGVCSEGNLNLACLFGATSGDAAPLRSLLGVVETVGAIIGLIVFLIFFGGTLLIAIGAAFLVLLARQMFVIALMLVAPLAILAWIFPGNDALWKSWWSIFSKLLIMFPLIMAIIAVGRIFALILNNTGGGSLDGAILNPIMKLGAYMLPYAFIPFTFKFAGGLFGNLAGIVNDKNKGLFDRAKQRRGAKLERAQQNRFFNPAGKLGRFNSAMGWAADPKNSARIKFGTTGGRALASELTQKSAQQSQELAKWMSGAGFNQEAATAVMKAVEDGDGVLTKSNLNKQIEALAQQGGTQNMAGVNALRNSGAYLLNTYKSEDFSRANIGMAAGYVKASQGFMNSSDPNELAHYSNFLNGVAPGLGETFKTQAGLMGSQGGLGKVGYSEQVDTLTGEYVAGGVAARAVQLSRSSVQDITGAKSGQLKQHFLGEGKALEQIMMSDGVSDVATGETIAIDDFKRRAVIDNVAQAAYGYNTPAETAAILRAELDRLSGPLDNQGRATTERGRMIQDATMQARRINADAARRDDGAGRPPEPAGGAPN